MFELTITRIKYPKNDTIEYEYESLDNLLMELKQMMTIFFLVFLNH